MSFALTTDILIKSVGRRVKSVQNDYLGVIIEITRNTSDSTIEYAILRSGQEERYYAIPVSSRIIKITEAGEIILQMSKEDLQVANGIKPEQCPSPNFHAEPCIFELLEYDGPQLSHQKSSGI